MMLDDGLAAQLCLTLETSWTVAYQDILSVGFSRQEYWSGLTFPSPRDLPYPETELGSPTLQVDTPSEPLGKSHWYCSLNFCSFYTDGRNQRDTNRWRNMPCSWIGRINIVKISILPKAFYTCNANNFTVSMEIQKTSNSQSNLKKEEWNWRNQHA